MSTPKDDLEAVRTVAETIKDFRPEEQQRIIRWVAEKLGLPLPFAIVERIAPEDGLPYANLSKPAANLAQSSVGGAIDIKTFMTLKKPRNDIQFAAAVAYYYRFESPQADRKDAIDKEILQDATRMAGRDRFSHPLATLNNAHKLGLLDRGPEKGTFIINTVGENLVAMTLPDGTANLKTGRKRATKKFAKVVTPSKNKRA